MTTTSSKFQSLSELIYAVEGAEIVVPPPDLPRAAVYYARKWGWAVFPLHPRSKRPMTQHGFLDATTDLEQIRRWWTAAPAANIGIPTGPVELGGIGFDAIDVDGETGRASLVELEANGEVPPVLATVFTPGDPGSGRGPGRHLYVLAQGQGNATALLPGVDVRGRGGFLVAPPSLGPSGGSYAWLAKPAGKP